MSGSSDTSPKVTFDHDKFMVQFDVQDYAPEELSIKTEGDVLIVMATKESKAKGGKSSVSKQFEQRFTLPSGVDPEKISSKLSNKGILTVNAPLEAAPKCFARRTEAIANQTGYHDRHANANSQSEGLPEPKMKYEKDRIEISIDAREYSPDDLDVKVEGNAIILTAKKEIQESGGTRTRIFEQKFSLPSGVKAELVKTSLTSDGVLVITAPRGDVVGHLVNTDSLENKMEKVLDPSSWENERRMEAAFNDRRRISAFDDFRRDSMRDETRIESAFDDLRRDSAFNSQIANSKQGSLFSNSTSLFDDLNLFAANSEQSGISHVQYDEDSYRIMVNVESYTPEELSIRTLDNTVIVEAKHEEKRRDGSSYETQSFSQSFTLPQGVDPESVRSALSKKGVLTISAPLPQTTKHSESGRMIPIKHL